MNILEDDETWDEEFDEENLDEFRNMVNQIWNSGQVPEELCIARVVSPGRFAMVLGGGCVVIGLTIRL